MFQPKNRVNLLLGIIAAGWFVVILAFDPHPTRPHRAPLSEMLEPAPSLEWTTDAGSVLPGLVRVLPGALPPPGPNQKRAGACDPEAAQVSVSGGCWVETKTPPPCPKGKQWEHEGRCWLPVAKAAPVPTSGGGALPGVADH